MDERGVTLTSEDGPERPGDGNARREVALGGREGVGRSGGLEEEPGKHGEPQATTTSYKEK